MNFVGKLACLVLSIRMILSQSLESKGSNEVANIHTLMAGMQVLQTISAAQIAHTLNVPVISTQFKAAKTELRQAMNTTCNIRDHIESLEDLRQEMADDIEVNALLVVLQHHQQDACHWVAKLVEAKTSVCSEEAISNMCLQWDALLISEAAEQELQLYIEETKVSTSEWLSKNIKRSAQKSISDTIMSYF